MLAIFAVITVVIASGCTGIPTAVSGGGVSIEAFEPDFPQIYTDESVQFRIKIRNTGTTDATDVKLQIFGADWETPGGTCKQEAQRKLLAANPQKGIEGETFNCYWSLKPKGDSIPEGMVMTYYPTARVTYKYSTTTIKSVTIGNVDELRAVQDRGGTLPAETMSTTTGPVSIVINVKGPIKVSTSNQVTFPIEITFTNSGGGIVAKSEADAKNYNYIKYDIKLDGLESADCKLSDELYLFRGQTNTVTCKLKSGSAPSIGTVQRLIKVTAGYAYILDKSSSFTAIGAAKS